MIVVCGDIARRASARLPTSHLLRAVYWDSMATSDGEWQIPGDSQEDSLHAIEIAATCMRNIALNALEAPATLPEEAAANPAALVVEGGKSGEEESPREKKSPTKISEEERLPFKPSWKRALEAAELVSEVPPLNGKIAVTVRFAPKEAWLQKTLYCDPKATWDDVKRAICTYDQQDHHRSKAQHPGQTWQHRIVGREDGLWRKHTEKISSTPLPGELEALWVGRSIGASAGSAVPANAIICAPEAQQQAKRRRKVDADSLADVVLVPNGRFF